jgi:predicted  nucleic acid-binding Zn-ribbon protein
MSANDKLKDALAELKSEREDLNRRIAAIESALGAAPERKKRGRRPRIEAPEES